MKNNPQLGIIDHIVPQIEQNSLRVLTMIPSYTTNIPNYVPATNTNINVCKIIKFIKLIIFTL